MKLPDTDTHFKTIETYQQRQWQAGVDATPDKRVAVDIGAHVGSFTVRYAAVFDSVIAIEPINTDYLFHNTQHLPNVIIQPVGISNCRTTLYAHNPAPENSGAWELTTEHNDRPVQVIPLDDIELHACDLIKIDCQGHELAITQGAAQTIHEYRPTLQIEQPNQELQDLLLSWSYAHCTTVGKDEIWVAKEREAPAPESRLR